MDREKGTGGMAYGCRGAFDRGPAFGSVPRTMNYQGYLTDGSGRPVSGALSMTFSLYPVDSGGSVLWTETHQNVTVTNGLYGVVLGNGTPDPVPIALPFDQQYYLGITVGTDDEMTPRLALTSAGYALRAEEADHATHASGVSISNGAASGKVLTSDASGVGSWQMPAEDSTKVAKTGDTMTGTLTITQSAPSGNGATIQKTDPSNSGHALYVTTNGPGAGHGIYSSSTGLSRAGFFEINNPLNGGEALFARTNGTASAVHGNVTGPGNAEILISPTRPTARRPFMSPPTVPAARDPSRSATPRAAAMPCTPRRTVPGMR